MKTIPVLLMAMLFVLGACNQATDKQAEESQEENKTEEATPAANGKVFAEDEKDILPIPEGARVFFANLRDGETVSSPVHIEFGIEGMEVEPAGQLAQGKGHHHVVVDGGSIERGTVVPTNETNIHFGKGQTDTDLELESGEHTLTLQFADGLHQSYGEQMSATITVTVE